MPLLATLRHLFRRLRARFCGPRAPSPLINISRTSARRTEIRRRSQSSSRPGSSASGISEYSHLSAGSRTSINQQRSVSGVSERPTPAAASSNGPPAFAGHPRIRWLRVQAVGNQLLHSLRRRRRRSPGISRPPSPHPVVFRRVLDRMSLDMWTVAAPEVPSTPLPSSPPPPLSNSISATSLASRPDPWEHLIETLPNLQRELQPGVTLTFYNPLFSHEQEVRAGPPTAPNTTVVMRWQAEIQASPQDSPPPSPAPPHPPPPAVIESPEEDNGPCPHALIRHLQSLFQPEVYKNSWWVEVEDESVELDPIDQPDVFYWRCPLCQQMLAFRDDGAAWGA